jgi:hypothetical protein
MVPFLTVLSYTSGVIGGMITELAIGKREKSKKIKRIIFLIFSSPKCI